MEDYLYDGVEIARLRSDVAYKPIRAGRRAAESTYALETGTDIVPLSFSSYEWTRSGSTPRNTIVRHDLSVYSGVRADEAEDAYDANLYRCVFNGSVEELQRRADAILAMDPTARVTMACGD
jgi:hypothetical protein